MPIPSHPKIFLSTGNFNKALVAAWVRVLEVVKGKAPKELIETMLKLFLIETTPPLKVVVGAAEVEEARASVEARLKIQTPESLRHLPQPVPAIKAANRQA